LRVLVTVAVLAVVASAAPAGALSSTPQRPQHPGGALLSGHRRGVHLSRAGRRMALALPGRADLRTYAVPVGDQGMVNSCVSWAIDYGLLGWYTNRAHRLGQPFAPMYGYAQINGGADNGALPTDAFDLLTNQGNDTSADYSHNDFDWADQPSPSEQNNAGHYKIAGYNVLFSGAPQPGARVAIETAIATGHPVAITLPIRPGFDNMGAGSTAIDTDLSGAIRGYHEVLALAYDTNGLIVENSWGTGWGFNGYGRISWAVVNQDVEEADDISGLAVDDAPATMYSVTPAPAPVSTVTTAATIPFTIRWVALGTIAQYDAWYSVDGGPNIPVRMGAKATSYTLRTAPGSTYTFTVQATDTLNNVSAPMTSAPFGPTLVPVSDPSIGYSGLWNSNPSMAWTNQTVAHATISATARSISWIADRSNSYGAARVYVDGSPRATIGLYALRAQSNLAVYTVDFGSVGAHTLTVEAVGTPGHPTVVIDGFLLRS
jgi:hypothetical protein